MTVGEAGLSWREPRGEDVIFITDLNAVGKRLAAVRTALSVVSPGRADRGTALWSSVEVGAATQSKLGGVFRGRGAVAVGLLQVRVG